MIDVFLPKMDVAFFSSDSRQSKLLHCTCTCIHWTFSTWNIKVICSKVKVSVIYSSQRSWMAEEANVSYGLFCKVFKMFFLIEIYKYFSIVRFVLVYNFDYHCHLFLLPFFYIWVGDCMLPLRLLVSSQCAEIVLINIYLKSFIIKALWPANKQIYFR